VHIGSHRRQRQMLSAAILLGRPRALSRRAAQGDSAGGLQILRGRRCRRRFWCRATPQCAWCSLATSDGAFKDQLRWVGDWNLVFFAKVSAPSGCSWQQKPHSVQELLFWTLDSSLFAKSDSQSAAMCPDGVCMTSPTPGMSAPNKRAHDLHACVVTSAAQGVPRLPRPIL